MWNQFYVWGLLLSLMAGGCLIVLAANIYISIKKEKVPPHKRKFRKVKFPQGFTTSAKEAYRSSESIRGMLEILESKYQKGKVHTRIVAAIDYLKNSRYKDYETTLFGYLSDGSTEHNHMYGEFIQSEVRKRKRLPFKQ